MPTISSSRVQPRVTPSTALLTRARARPCTAACESFSRTATRCPSCCSTRVPRGSGVSSLPFGPCTATVLPSNFTVTPLGSGIGFFPILDIVSTRRSQLCSLAGSQCPVANKRFLPDFAQEFTTQAFFAGLPSGHHTARGGENIDSQPAENARDLGAAHIDATPGT